MMDFKKIMKQFGNSHFVLQHYKDLLQLRHHVIKGDSVQFLKYNPHKQHILYLKVQNNHIYSALGVEYNHKPMSKSELLSTVKNGIRISEKNPVLRQNPEAIKLIQVNHHHGQLAFNVQANQSYYPKRNIIRKTMGKSRTDLAKINRQDYRGLSKLSSIIQHGSNGVEFLNKHNNLKTRLYAHPTKQGQILLNNGKSSFSSKEQFSHFIRQIMRGMQNTPGVSTKFQQKIQKKYHLSGLGAHSISDVFQDKIHGENQDNNWNKNNSKYIAVHRPHYVHKVLQKIHRFHQTSLHLE